MHTYSYTMNLPQQPYSRDIQELLDTLDARQDGLSRQEAEARHEQWGPNTLPKQKEQHPIMRFLSHFHNVLIYVLIGAGIITALLDHWIDTWIILAVVVINAVIGYIQEGKAEKALKAVEGMLSHYARVIRDGDVRQIEASRLVPGDIVAVEANPGHDIGIVSLTGELVAQQMKKHKVTIVNGELRKIYRKARPLDIKNGKRLFHRRIRQ